MSLATVSGTVAAVRVSSGAPTAVRYRIRTSPLAPHEPPGWASAGDAASAKTARPIPRSSGRGGSRSRRLGCMGADRISESSRSCDPSSRARALPPRTSCSDSTADPRPDPLRHDLDLRDFGLDLGLPPPPPHGKKKRPFFALDSSRDRRNERLRSVAAKRRTLPFFAPRATCSTIRRCSLQASKLLRRHSRHRRTLARPGRFALARPGAGAVRGDRDDRRQRLRRLLRRRRPGHVRGDRKPVRHCNRSGRRGLLRGRGAPPDPPHRSGHRHHHDDRGHRSAAEWYLEDGPNGDEGPATSAQIGDAITLAIDRARRPALPAEHQHPACAKGRSRHRHHPRLRGRRHERRPPGPLGRGRRAGPERILDDANGARRRRPGATC